MGTTVRFLRYEDIYRFGFMEGFRLEQIKASRKWIIRFKNIKCKEQNYIPGKILVSKINKDEF